MNLRTVAKSLGRLLGLALLLLGVIGVVFIYPAWRKAAQNRDAANAQSQLKLQENRRKGEQGDAESQFRVGVAYFYGQGVQADDMEALRWLRKAASQKNEHALDLLKIRTTFQEYKAKAEQGDAAAQNQMGVNHMLGQGVKKDEAEAVKWFLLAAAQGHAGAQGHLVGCYQLGDGVKPDKPEAYAWASVSTNTTAARRKEALSRTMSADQIEAGKRRAEELRAQIAERLKAKSDSKP